MTRSTLILLCAALLGSGTAIAEPAADPSRAPAEDSPGTEPIEEIVVSSPRLRAAEAGMLADSIQQTEVVSLKDLESGQATVLSEALQNTPGVRVNNECSMCGVKRVMLNGLGGQHTNILVDGLPAHTLVSGFYSPDALAIAGVERIEIARGAGASLIAPEAIGGTVNIVTHSPNYTGGSIDASGGENGYRQGRVIGTYTNERGSIRGLAAYQYDSRDQYDGDGNGVNESPFVRNHNVSAALAIDPSDVSTLNLRAGWTESEIFGGPMLGDLVGSIDETLAGFDDMTSDQLFAGDDVRNRFVGKPWETTEWILTERLEFSARYFRDLGENLNAEAAVSLADHRQDSFYEGFDYRADNDLVFLDARAHWAVNADHLLTIGGDWRDESLRSASDAAIGRPDYVSDSFDYLSRGLYIQDTWTPNDRLEVALAIRLDAIEADFVDPARPGTEIEETLVSPRLDSRYRHNDAWTSRLSIGRGYRAPLSFFESDHGILDAGQGFIVDVTKLERSISTSYSLSYAGDRLAVNGAVAWTEVENLAALDETETGIPILTQRDGTGTVIAVTFDAGYEVTGNLTLSVTAETFDHDELARSIFGVAPVEERLVTGIEWTPGAWDADVTLAWIGERDLTRYGYEGYNDAAATLPKALVGDAYVTLDARVEYAMSDRVAFYAGGRNLTDYNQAGDDDTPLFFGPDGAFDVGYIYAPLRGREMYAGFRAEF